MGHSVSYLTADGIVVAEGGMGLDVVLDVFHDAAKFVKGLRGLAIEIDISTEVEALDIFGAFDDDGGSFGLPHQSQNFGMSVLPENHDLFPMFGVGVVFAFDAFLQVKDHGTGGIDDFDVVLLGLLVGLGWFAMGTK